MKPDRDWPNCLDRQKETDRILSTCRPRPAGESASNQSQTMRKCDREGLATSLSNSQTPRNESPATNTSNQKQRERRKPNLGFESSVVCLGTKGRKRVGSALQIERVKLHQVFSHNLIRIDKDHSAKLSVNQHSKAETKPSRLSTELGNNTSRNRILYAQMCRCFSD